MHPLRRSEALVFAHELDISLLPEVGYTWMSKGFQVKVITPGTNKEHYLAGALDLATCTVHHALGPRKTHELSRELLQRLDGAYPTPHSKRIYVVVDNYKIHKAKAVEQWLAKQLCFKLLFVPTYCPHANPIERAFSGVHDLCTSNHTCKWCL